MDSAKAKLLFILCSIFRLPKAVGCVELKNKKGKENRNIIPISVLFSLAKLYICKEGE